MDILSVKIEKPDEVNVIVGQSHFVKTVEDLYETIVSAVPGIQFGLAFCEASGACKLLGPRLGPRCFRPFPAKPQRVRAAGR